MPTRVQDLVQDDAVENGRFPASLNCRDLQAVSERLKGGGIEPPN